VGSIIERVKAFRGTSVAEVQEMSEAASDMASWFPGGFKELKEKNPTWTSIEGKLDALDEFIAVSRDMRAFVDEALPPDASLAKLKAMFECRSRFWGSCETAVERWSRAGLPTDAELVHSALAKLQNLPQVALTLVEPEFAEVSALTVETAATSKKVEAVKTKAKDGLNLVLEISTYTGVTPADPTMKPESFRLAEMFFSLVLKQYNEFLHDQPKTAVIAAFESSLKIVGILKSICFVRGKKGAAHTTVDASVRQLLVKLTGIVLQHVIDFASNSEEAAAADPAKFQKDMTSWLLFGCKYIKQVVELVGDVEDAGVTRLIGAFVAIEMELSAG